MKRIIVFTFFISGIISLAAQENKIGLSFLQNYSTFRFVDSAGVKEDLNYTIKFGYGLSYQKLLGEHFLIEAMLLYNNKGANSSLDQEKLDWSLHYINADLGIGYNFGTGRLHPQIGGHLYYGRLVKGDQFIGSVNYDLMETGKINKNDFGVNVFAGLDYGYSDNGSVFLRMNESIGLLQLEEGNSDQKMFNRTFSIQLGLFFNIK